MEILSKATWREREVNVAGCGIIQITKAYFGASFQSKIYHALRVSQSARLQSQECDMAEVPCGTAKNS